MKRPLPHVTLTRHTTEPALAAAGPQGYYLAHLWRAGEEVEHGFGYTSGDAIRSLAAALGEGELRRAKRFVKRVTGWQL